MRRRAIIAWSVSLCGHALALFAVVRLCAVFQTSPNPSKPAVNRVIDAPIEYGSVSVSFAEESNRKPEPKQTEPKSTPQPRDKSSDPTMVARAQNEPSKPDIKPGLVQASHEQGSPPLHGSITRAGASIVYVLDQSGSMARERKLQQAIAMLKSSLRQLGPDVRFQIVCYDSQPTVLRIAGSRELVSANSENKEQALSLLADLVGEGSSRHAEALIAGLSLHPDLLILLTDTDEMSPSEAARVKQWNRKGTAIHAVIFGQTPASKNSLSALTGPEHLHVAKFR